MTTTEDHKEAQVYELGYLVLPSVPEEGLEKVVSNIRSIIEKAGGKTLDGEDPVIEDLAYSMSKTIGARKYVVDEAYIGWTKFEAEPSMIEVVKTGVEKIDEILRHLLIKVPRETTFTFAAARQARAEREAALQVVETEDAEVAPVETEDAEVAPVETEDAEVAPEAVVEGEKAEPTSPNVVE